MARRFCRHLTDTIGMRQPMRRISSSALSVSLFAPMAVLLANLRSLGLTDPREQFCERF